MSDIYWMRRAEEMATQAAQAKETAVGSVLMTQQGNVHAEGSESVVSENDPSAHAEAQAIRAACRLLRHRDLSGCVLYTTVEPCFLCAYLIRVTHIARVVIGKPVEGIGGATSCYPILTTTRIPDFGKPPEVVWIAPNAPLVRVPS